MISNGYHYVINLGIAWYRPWISWILCPKIYCSEWTQRNLDFPLLHWSLSPLSTMNFLSILSFILSIVHTIKVLKYYFVFMSIFIFHIICSSSKKHPLANRSLVRTLSLEGVTLGCKPLFWISDNLSEILKT